MPTRPLYALTLHRPFSWAVSHAGKRVENREWAPPVWLVGRYLAIHAGKTYDPMAADVIASHIGSAVPPAEECPLGIVAVAKVVGHTTNPEQLTDDQHAWFSGPIGWLLADVVEIAPVACRGMQKLWRVPQMVADVVRERWRIATSNTPVPQKNGA